MAQADKFTPAGWHWKITPEQIEKIKANDRATINQVYFDNYDQFIGIARNYCRKVKRPELWRDCVQQIYVDLPFYRYGNIHSLFQSLKDTFRYACGLPKGVSIYDTVSLDKLLYGESDRTKKTLADTIAAPETVTDTERQENERHALEIIAAQSQLGERGRDVLTAFALSCPAYKGLFAYEYSYFRSR